MASSGPASAPLCASAAREEAAAFCLRVGLRWLPGNKPVPPTRGTTFSSPHVLSVLAQHDDRASVSQATSSPPGLGTAPGLVPARARLCFKGLWRVVPRSLSLSGRGCHPRLPPRRRRESLGRNRGFRGLSGTRRPGQVSALRPAVNLPGRQDAGSQARFPCFLCSPARLGFS